MEQYKLSSHIDPNNFFLINHSELEGRIDPQQYHSERIETVKRLRINNEIVKLKDVVCSAKKTTTDIKASDIYIGLENIVSNTGEYIATTDKQSISSANIFKRGSILFPKLRPYLNKVHLAEFDGVCSTEFHVFNSRSFDNEFLSIYLRSDIIVNQTKHLMTGNTLPRLQTEDINNLPVPKLPIDLQLQIVDFYKKANIVKLQKEAEAKALLESIDSYLLKELGIMLPGKTELKANDIPTWMNPENLLVKNGRLFTTSFRDLSGNRFDPLNVLNIGRKSISAIYENTTLKAIANIKKGQSITSSEIIQGDYPVIAGGQSSPYSHNSYNNEANVITVSASGAYSGFVWYHDYPIFASDCSVIYSKDETKFSTKYIFEVLKVKQNEIYLLQQGAGQPHVYSNDLAKLWIPIVSKEVQDEIIKHIDSIRTQAKMLQVKANSILEIAKKDVERMILGE
jgi:type I restriction enzyme S subunit